MVIIFTYIYFLRIPFIWTKERNCMRMKITWRPRKGVFQQSLPPPCPGNCRVEEVSTVILVCVHIDRISFEAGLKNSSWGAHRSLSPLGGPGGRISWIFELGTNGVSAARPPSQATPNLHLVTTVPYLRRPGFKSLLWFYDDVKVISIL